jgi:hypothetical protein
MSPSAVAMSISFSIKFDVPAFVRQQADGPERGPSAVFPHLS